MNSHARLFCIWNRDWPVNALYDPRSLAGAFYRQAFAHEATPQLGPGSDDEIDAFKEQLKRNA